MQLPPNPFPPIDFAIIPTYYFLVFPTISTMLGSPMELKSIIYYDSMYSLDVEIIVQVSSMNYNVTIM